MDEIDFCFNFSPYSIEELEEYSNSPCKTIEESKHFSWDDGVRIAGIELFKSLRQKYPHVKIKPRLASNKQCCCPKDGIATISIRNALTKKFIVISMCDRLDYIGPGSLPKDHPFYEEYKDNWGWDMENCVKILPAVGVHDNNSTFQLKQSSPPYTPSTICLYHPKAEVEIEKKFSNPNRQVPDKPFIRMHHSTWFREYLTKDARFEVRAGRISVQEFVEEMSRSPIALDVNGVAEISNRTLEAFGLGLALIRPKLTIQYHNPLIPNFHYAAVDCEDLSDFKALSDSYIRKFNELKDNPELIKYYGKNGREWYLENCKLEGFLSVFANKLINLNDIGITT